MKPLSLLQNLLGWFTGRLSGMPGKLGRGSCSIKADRMYQSAEGVELGTEQKNLGIVQICYGMFKARTRGREEEDQSWSGEEGVWGEKRREGRNKRGQLHLTRQPISTFAWQSPVAWSPWLILSYWTVFSFFFFFFPPVNVCLGCVCDLLADFKLD